jgi:hypothetical protein
MCGGCHSVRHSLPSLIAACLSFVRDQDLRVRVVSGHRVSVSVSCGVCVPYSAHGRWFGPRSRSALLNICSS